MSGTLSCHRRAATYAVGALRARFAYVNEPFSAPDRPAAVDVVIGGETGQYRVRVTSLPVGLEIDVHARRHGEDWGSMPGLAASVGYDFGAAAPSQREIAHAFATIAAKLQAFEHSGSFLAVGAITAP